MNKFSRKLDLTALAGSLVATSAFAGAMSQLAGSASSERWYHTVVKVIDAANPYSNLYGKGINFFWFR